jgi:hypothetical protein
VAKDLPLSWGEALPGLHHLGLDGHMDVVETLHFTNLPGIAQGHLGVTPRNGQNCTLRADEGAAINPLARSPQISAISSDSAALQRMAKIFGFWPRLHDGRRRKAGLQSPFRLDYTA